MILIDAAIVVVGLIIVAYWVLGITRIGPDRVGLVEKRWSAKGSLDKAIIALNGEAGYQPDLLRGGIHFRSRIQYNDPPRAAGHDPPGARSATSSRATANRCSRSRRWVAWSRATPTRTCASSSPTAASAARSARSSARARYAFNLINFVVITQSRLYYMKIESDDREIVDGMAQASWRSTPSSRSSSAPAAP